MTNLKPGFLTTEFWVTAIVSILSVLAGFGVIGPQDQTQLMEAAKAIVGGVSAVLFILHYIESRKALKTAALHSTLALPSKKSGGGSPKS